MAETDVVVVLASTLSCHIGRHSPDNSRTGLNNSIFCIPLGVRQPVTQGQCQQSQCRSTLIDDYLLRPRMSVQGASLQGRPSGKFSHIRCDAESGSQFKLASIRIWLRANESTPNPRSL